jgi:hypothetical protein
LCRDFRFHGFSDGKHPSRFELLFNETDRYRWSLCRVLGDANVSPMRSASSTTFQIKPQRAAVSAASGSPSSASDRARLPCEKIWHFDA